MYYNWRRVRYENAGLNNLKSELSISVNCYTSVNVDLSMSLNCSFLYGVCMCALRTVTFQDAGRQYGFDSRILHIDMHMTGGELKKIYRLGGLTNG